MRLTLKDFIEKHFLANIMCFSEFVPGIVRMKTCEKNNLFCQNYNKMMVIKYYQLILTKKIILLKYFDFNKKNLKPTIFYKTK